MPSSPLGRLRPTQTVHALRTSAKAEASVVEASGLTRATGLGRPPFVATGSFWQTTPALSTYAYRDRAAAQLGAVAADKSKRFHHQAALIRFRPYSFEGSLGG